MCLSRRLPGSHVAQERPRRNAWRGRSWGEGSRKAGVRGEGSWPEPLLSSFWGKDTQLEPRPWGHPSPALASTVYGGGASREQRPPPGPRGCSPKHSGLGLSGWLGRVGRGRGAHGLFPLVSTRWPGDREQEEARLYLGPPHEARGVEAALAWESGGETPPRSTPPPRGTSPLARPGAQSSGEKARPFPFSVASGAAPRRPALRDSPCPSPPVMQKCLPTKQATELQRSWLLAAPGPPRRGHLHRGGGGNLDLDP